MRTSLLHARWSLPVALIASAAAHGCIEDVDPTLGERRNLRFTLTNSAGCANLFSYGCAIDRPLLNGVDERVRVRRGSGALPVNLMFVSSNPAVFTVASTTAPSTSDSEPSYFVNIHASGEGTAHFEARASDGTLLDRFALRVASASSVEFTANQAGLLPPGATEVRLRVGERIDIVGHGRDAQGNRLFSNNGVTWTVPDTSTVRLSWGLMPEGARIVDDRVYLTGVAQGTVTVTATVGMVNRTIQAVVIP